MATWTATDLRNNALERLGVKARGQSPAAEDAARVDAIWTSLHEQLLHEESVNFAVGAIPEWAQQPLVKILAREAAPEFGFHGNRFVEHEVAGKEGRMELDRQASGKKRRHPVRGNFF